jgi:arylsulfatase A-like enzyme
MLHGIEALKLASRFLAACVVLIVFQTNERLAFAQETQVVEIDSSQAWTNVVQVQQGDRISFRASGTFTARCEDRFGQGDSTSVGAEGTYLISNGIADQKFPLPAGTHGPAPAYALIGYIDGQNPFFVGAKTTHVANVSGMLHLGINDFAPDQNQGVLRVEFEINGQPDPLRIEHRVRPAVAPGKPASNCRVVVFYVDGLRPDVVQEMTAMGHLPAIRELFLDNGTWLANTFTSFPSDTITSNGTMWTGCFSDRHGLKGQVRFSRIALTSASYLETLGPSRSSRLISPQGADRWAADAQTKIRSWVQGRPQARQWYQQNVTDTPAIYEHLRRNGKDWSTGLLPLMTEVPPLMWTRSISRELPWLEAHNAWQYVDDANANYALQHLLHLEQPVTILWMPETDSVSHKHCRGQFGKTRRTIAKADQLIDQVVSELKRRGTFEQTYFLLVSDHGHHGGRDQHLRHFDVANELFFRARKVTKDGAWVGGGMGMSVRMHRSWNRHPGHHQREFAFIDGDSDGAARIFLPRKNFKSRDWNGANAPGDLLQYRLRPNGRPFDLVSTLANAQAADGERTVDLVLMRLSEQAMLISTSDRGHAVIDRKLGNSGRWVYRYRPVSRVWGDGEGGAFFSVNTKATTDPLGLTKFLSERHFSNYFSEHAWLEATAMTKYPDSIVALSRHMLWQGNLLGRQKEYSPDLVITARPGWYFGTKGTPGTTHGYPLADAMRASWFVSGPNVRKGARIDAPCRLVDLTPTILDMVGTRVDPNWFDGYSQRHIFEVNQLATDEEQPNADQRNSVVQRTAFEDSPLKQHAQKTAMLFRHRYDAGRIRLMSHSVRPVVVDTVRQPIHWRDVDLDAWHPLTYQANAESTRKPLSINRPSAMVDLNNAFYNAAAMSDVSVFRVFDDLLFPLSSDRPVARRVENLDRRLRNNDREWIAEGMRVLNVSEASVSDYSTSSLGNMKRANGAVDWIQERSTALDRRINGDTTSKANQVVNRILDGTQTGFWEVYRFGQRITVKAIDETLLNGIENVADRAINSINREPAEIIVE